ncbi:MAG: FliM/FliN family flagellar motor switch protein [Planctomycetaceae bacterium]|nr:FliM/FliN family flagellar motor switch protein [Planctomycetaceae bacterium]MCA9113815.1 FliM/FliN family flagellar motor switch protein [Planctomycetaceae bacterium]
MTAPPQIQPDQLYARCADHLPALAESFNLCFDRTCQVEMLQTEPVSWKDFQLQDEYHGAGLLVAIRIGGQGMLCLLPESLRLPEWYLNPGQTEEARLQSLAFEWARNLLPDEIEPDDFVSLAVPQLAEEVVGAGPTDDAWAVTLKVVDPVASTEDESDSPGSILILWPVARPPFPQEEEVDIDPRLLEPEPPARASTDQPAEPVHQRLRRVSHLSVTVSVRLAEKRIRLGQLLALSPGALITFSRSCEELLDLYVNNHRFCSGEAVKIGEKFGLKINEVGVRPVRKKSVIQG